jgi:WD40 repeat protein
LHKKEVYKMTRLRWVFILSGLAALLLSANLALAKGPWGKVEISGEGLSGVVEITDPQLLNDLSIGIFQDLALGSIDTPEVVGGGYKMLRGWDNEQGVFTPFDLVHYYADPRGGPGYLYYDGLVNGGSEFDHHWYRVTPEGEKAIQQFFAAHDIKTRKADQVRARVLSGHTDAVTILKWSPDGSLLASSAGDWDSTDHDVRLWSADGSHYETLIGHSAPIQAMAWSPDGKTLATGSADQTIQLWDNAGKWLQTIEVDEGTIFGLDWSRDGSLLASASLAGTSQNLIQIWDADGTLLHSLATDYSGGKFLNVEWSPDGQYLVGGAIDYKEWRADGTLVFSHESCEHCTPAWGLAWSPDSQFWAIGNESGNVWVYNVDGTEVAQLHNDGNVDTIAWSPDGSLLAGGNSIWAWDVAAFKQQGGISSGRIWNLAWSPDNAEIATVATNSDEVRLWDTSGKRLAILSGHPGNVQQLAWSPDGTQLASGGADQTIRLWDMNPAP